MRIGYPDLMARIIKGEFQIPSPGPAIIHPSDWLPSRQTDDIRFIHRMNGLYNWPNRVRGEERGWISTNRNAQKLNTTALFQIFAFRYSAGH